MSWTSCLAMPQDTFAKLVTSTTVSQVTETLTSLNIYDPSAGITSWKAAAKLFDDWRLVVSGPHTADLWALRNVGELGSNQHSMWLCYGCPIASKWGPFEDMYCALEHEGCINAVNLPKPKAKGRPKTSALRARRRACARLSAGKQFWGCFFHVCPTKGAPHVRS